MKRRKAAKNIFNNKVYLYNLMTIDDYIKDYCSSKTLLVPINLRSAKNALAKGHHIQIEMDDGSIKTVSTLNDIDKFIKKNNLRLYE